MTKAHKNWLQKNLGGGVAFKIDYSRDIAISE